MWKRICSCLGKTEEEEEPPAYSPLAPTALVPKSDGDARDLPDDVIAMLCKLLADRPLAWRGVATRLGVNQEDIDGIAAFKDETYEFFRCIPHTPAQWRAAFVAEGLSDVVKAWDGSHHVARGAF